MIKCELSKTSIDKNIKALKDKNYIKRQGSKKTGYWEVIEEKEQDFNNVLND